MSGPFLSKCHVCAFAVAVMISGCSSENENKVVVENGPSAIMPHSEARDVSGRAEGVAGLGGLEYVEIEATGFGPTATTAIDDALYSAIRQVNGVTIAGGTVEYAGAAYVRSNVGSVDVMTSGFASAVVSQSQGSIASFSINSLTNGSDSVSAVEAANGYRVSISAKIAKYKSSEAATRPGLIVAKPKFLSVSVNAGDFSRESFGRLVKQQLEDRIVATNRFAVVNRSLTDAALNELRVAASDLTPIEQKARIGKLISAEVMIVPTVVSVRYTKSSRPLRTSDRDIITYSAGLQMRYDAINVTTGQTIFSKSYERALSVPKPSTFEARVDPQGAFNVEVTAISDDFLGELVSRTFPVSLIALDGNNAVLSQGGAALKAGSTYELLNKGEVFFDPQTGQSLGAEPIPIGTVRVTRVGINVSHGEVKPLSEAEPIVFTLGGLELGEIINDSSPAVGEDVAASRRVPLEQKPMDTRPPSPSLVPSPELNGGNLSEDKDDDW